MKRLLAVILIVSMSFSMLAGCDGNEKNQIDDNTARTEILDQFTKLAEIPRESGHERAVSTYLKTWAKDNGFNVTRDKSNNIIIEAPATAGYENAPTTILQSNMDMHCIVAENTTFSAISDPITIIKNKTSYLAAGTNLGADSGIGVATALYVLKHSVNHGPLRVIFTVNGESGFTGAEKLNPKYLEGNYLVNLNWNSKDTVGASSAGTVSYQMTRKISWTAPKNTIPYEISIAGLNGGDANKDINSGNANAVKVLGETMAKLQGEGILFELASFNGGLTSDTIPAAATAVVIINDSDLKKLKNVLDNAIDEFDNTFGDVEKNYTFTYQEAVMPGKVVSFEDNSSIISFIYGVVNGVQKMSEDFTDMPESSSNIGVVSTFTGNFLAGVSVAGNSVSSLQEITSAHEAITTMSAVEVKTENGTPIWEYQPKNPLYKAFQDIYLNTFNQKIKLGATHNETECSWFLEKNPELMMVSIGPDIKNPDTPEETLVLDSVSDPATAILAFLEQTKE